MEYLVFLDHFEASPKKLIEASGKTAAREIFRREVMIHSRPFLEMAYGRSGPGAWITTHLATCRDIDGPRTFHDVRRIVAERIPAFDGYPAFARRYRRFFFGAPRALDPHHTEGLEQLIEMYPFPDQMLLMMDAALDRGRFESSAPDDRSAWDRGYTILSTEELRNGIDLQQVAAMQRRYR
jgi:hypothetical protein